MRKIKMSRFLVLLIFFGLLFFILIGRLFQLQIIHGGEYMENFSLKTKREILLKGTRGNIYDRNGKPLARNQLAYAVTFEDAIEYDTSRERQLSLNGNIYRMITIIKEHGDSIENSLKIDVDRSGNYQFTAEGFSLDRFKADIYGKSQVEDMTQKEKASTAEDVMEFLSGEEKFCVFSENGAPYTKAEKRKYGLPEDMGKEDLLDLLSVRYSLFLQTYQKYLPVIAARNVSQETLAAIMENQPEIEGVNVEEDSIRVYEGGEACAPILGYTGTISVEELKEKEEEGYSLSSVVGKSGMEQYLEETLKGKDGRREVFVDNVGRMTYDSGVVDEPQAGKDVYLSIDVTLQNEIYHALEQKIADLLLENIINAKTFDKTAVSDATEIRIPIYDVYVSLLTNEVMDLSHFQGKEASELEKDIYEKFRKKRKDVISKVQKELENPSGPFSELSKDMQKYQQFIIENLDIFKRDEIDTVSEIYKKWENGEASLREYIQEAIKEEWVDLSRLDSNEAYLKQDEVYSLVISYIAEELKRDYEFEKIVYGQMVMADEILPEQICMLLYEQGILSKQDEEFEGWQQGAISSYDLIIRKIQKLEITPANLALDPCSGSAVVVDTKTGKLLACVSYPGYDNNRLANQMDHDYYFRIYNNKSLPLYNRATQQLSAPGSTFKPVTIIAGLEEEVIVPSTEVFCDGVFDQVDPPLKCWNHMGHGSVSGAASALKNSCNDYLCEISYRLGMTDSDTFSDEQALKVIQKYAELFDLDKKSGIELPESEPQVTDKYAIPSAIGQGTNNFSTVQLGRYAATLANKGTSFRLSLIEKVDGVKKESKIVSDIHLPAEVWDSVHTGMEWYAQDTGIFDGFPIPSAGKSGTAQEVNTRPDHGLFVGYAPAEDPQIAAAIRIVNGYSAAPAVECGRKIFESYFHQN